MINQVAFEGIISKQDPVFVKHEKGGYCHFKLFQSSGKRNQETGEYLDGTLVNCMIWGEQAEFFCSETVKHTRILINGYIKTNFKEDRMFTTVHVTKYEIVPKGGARANPSTVKVEDSEDAVIEF